MLGAFVVSSLALAIGAWSPRRQGIPDWFMRIGGTILLLGIMATASFFIFPNLGSSVLGGEAAGVIVYSSVSGGLLLFSMGYLADRIRQRASGSH